MKRNLYFLNLGILLALFSFFISCNKDKEEKEESLSEILIGKWKLISEQQKIFMNNTLFDDTTTIYEDAIIEFMENGDGSVREKNELVFNFTWQLNGTTLTMDIPDEGEVDFKVVYDAKTKKSTLTLSETETVENTTWKYETIITARKL